MRLAPRSMTLDDLEQEATYFPVSDVNISQTVRTAVARFASARLSCNILYQRSHFDRQ